MLRLHKVFYTGIRTASLLNNTDDITYVTFLGSIDSIEILVCDEVKHFVDNRKDE